jgi:hypothetical protein
MTSDDRDFRPCRVDGDDTDIVVQQPACWGVEAMSRRLMALSAILGVLVVVVVLVARRAGPRRAVSPASLDERRGSPQESTRNHLWTGRRDFGGGAEGDRELLGRRLISRQTSAGPAGTYRRGRRRGSC